MLDENLKRKLCICECCGKELSDPFVMQYLRGLEKHRACPDCAKEYFDQIKAKYFVEEYKGNKFYKYDGKYFPYWDAQYYFNSIEECRKRADSNTSVVNMSAFHMTNNLLK